MESIPDDRADFDILRVEDAAGLDRLLERLAGQSVLTLDTEFAADRSYVPRLCLIQVAGDGVAACVDPLAGFDLAPLWERLSDPAVLKVLHAGENDLPLLGGPEHEVLPGPVFDTQIAAGLCGLGWPIGYGDLVRELTGMKLDKSMQRTDWAARPLPQDAVLYAVRDVTHLRAAHRHLADRLAERARSAWIEEEGRALVDPARYRRDPQDAWLRVRGCERLDGIGRAVLKELAAWREQTARSTNRPRRWVVPDEVLAGAAQRLPQSEGELRAIRGFEVRRHGMHVAPVLAIVKAARRLPEAKWPAAGGKARDSQERSALEVLQGLVHGVAAQHDIDPGLAAENTELLAALRGDRDGRLFSGWRGELFGVALRDVLDRGRALRVGPDGVRIE